MQIQFALKHLSLIVIISSIFLIQCNNEKTESVKEQSQPTVENTVDKIKRDSIKKDSVEKAAITYTNFIFPKSKKDSALAAFKAQFSEEEQYTILALNRYDQANLWRVDTLVIPNKFQDNFLKYSPFPVQVDLLKDVEKFVFFSYPIQAYAVYENGSQTKWGPTSMGKKAAITKRGLHFTNWKAELATSTVDSSWKLPHNVNIANRLGIGWHEYDLPGFPASHSCLRLLKKDAEWLYDFTDQWILSDDRNTVKANGIPVIVDGDYAWGEKKPWRAIVNGKINDNISDTQMNDAIQPFIEKILKEQKNREEVLMAENS